MQRILLASLTTLVACAPASSADERLAALEQRVARLETGARSSGNLLPAAEGSSDLPTSSGTLFVRVDSVSPHLGGARVFATIGNPTTAAFHDLATTVEWGVAQDASDMRRRELTIRTTLTPGAWTAVAFDLADARPTDLGYLRLSATRLVRFSLDQ